MITDRAETHKIDSHDFVVKGPQCYQDDQKNSWHNVTCPDGIVVPQTAARSSTRYSLYHIYSSLDIKRKYNKFADALIQWRYLYLPRKYYIGNWHESFMMKRYDGENYIKTYSIATEDYVTAISRLKILAGNFSGAKISTDQDGKILCSSERNESGNISIAGKQTIHENSCIHSLFKKIELWRHCDVMKNWYNLKYLVGSRSTDDWIQRYTGWR